MLQLINSPTRKSSFSNIDHIIVPKKTDLIFKTAVESIPITDHNPISCKIVFPETLPPITQHNQMFLPNYKFKNFNEAVSLIDWSILYDIKDVNIATDYFISNVLNIYANLCIIKNIKNQKSMTLTKSGCQKKHC